jgi:hypothetical protein
MAATKWHDGQISDGAVKLFPHGEERVFARLRTMLRIARRTTVTDAAILRDAAQSAAQDEAFVWGMALKPLPSSHI